jgi:ABC-type phosphate transport system substrate-binding protein
MKKVVALGAAVGVALAGLGLALPANAEPVSNGYVLVGSDTLQDSTNALLNGTSVGGAPVRVTSAGSTLGSFDAFGSTAIQTKSGGQYFGRPAGSGAGVTALRASITGNAYSGNPAVPARVITGQVDIARSSSGPGGNANTSGLLAYVPYGRDAVAYAYNGTNSDLANLTTAQLKQIYEASTPVTIGTTVVKPRIPQNGSGTRSFFLSAIGVTTLGSTVPDSNNTTPENDASILGADEIIPFSAASWVAQSNGATGINTIAAPSAATVKLGNPNGVAPFTGSGTALVPNTAFYSAAPFGRDTYLVVEYARIDSSSTKYDANLFNLLDPSKTQSLTNTGTFASTTGAAKRKFGFLAPSSTTIVRAYATL